MVDNNERISKVHNTAIVIITVACVGAIIESLSQGWELWVPPLIVGALIASWWFHLTQYSRPAFRENFYLILSTVVAFFHGVHETSFFDLIVISVLLMTTATLLKRPEFLNIFLLEFYVLLFIQLFLAIKGGETEFDALTISRIILHVLVEICIYVELKSLLKERLKADETLLRKKKEEDADRVGMEDFLVNISHELRTPVNVINGMSALILKNEEREDVVSIRDAGLRLSRQIEDIQDYSEIQRGDVVLTDEKYMITSLLNDITSYYGAFSRSDRPELVVDLDPTLPAMLKGDVKKIHKLITLLLDNAFKFTRRGGVYLHITGYKKDYGLNLIIEVSDTGVGMTQSDIEKISRGSYQANRKRNRSTGGIGLGLSIVYGFVRFMKGFVSIDSVKGKGTTVRLSIVQEIVNPEPCLYVDNVSLLNTVFYVMPEKHKLTALKEFYNVMAVHMAEGLNIKYNAATSRRDLEKLLEREKITHLFMGLEEYEQAPEYYERLTSEGVTVTVSAPIGYRAGRESRVVVMPKPLYGYQVAKVLNGDTGADELIHGVDEVKPKLDGLRALVVDDEELNLVVAAGLFRGYKMIVDTAESGREAVLKCDNNDYDVVFMDHMMPEMDGVEAMKLIKLGAEQKGRKICVIALTANALSGAREMFLSEGFDGFISKPINIKDFEKVMNREFGSSRPDRTGGM